MDKNEQGIFEPRNPIFLDFAKWVVIITSGITLLLGIVSLSNLPNYGLLLILGSILYYFSGMVFVNMLFNIRDIKEQTYQTNKLLEKQIALLKQKEID